MNRISRSTQYARLLQAVALQFTCDLSRHVFVPHFLPVRIKWDSKQGIRSYQANCKKGSEGCRATTCSMSPFQSWFMTGRRSLGSHCERKAGFSPTDEAGAPCVLLLACPAQGAMSLFVNEAIVKFAERITHQPGVMQSLTSHDAVLVRLRRSLQDLLGFARDRAFVLHELRGSV